MRYARIDGRRPSEGSPHTDFCADLGCRAAHPPGRLGRAAESAAKNKTARADLRSIGSLLLVGRLSEVRDDGVVGAGRWHTDNDLRGATRNPWSASVTPGGSSGGDAVAVSTGMAPIGLGNDGAGSLRWPAQCCGVAARKPSLGRVGGRGGPVPFAFQLLAVHGPIARSVDDLRLVYESMCGRPAGDPWYAPVPLSGPPLPRRVHAVLDLAGIEAPVAAALRTAAGRLEDAGYEVLVGTPPALDRAAELFVQVMSACGRVHEHQPPVEAVAGADFVRFWAAFEPAWAAAAGPSAFDPMMERAAIARAWHDWMVAAPLVLAPVRTGPAFRAGADPTLPGSCSSRRACGRPGR